MVKKTKNKKTKQKVDSDIKYISSSEINDYIQCPLYYYRKHINNKKILDMKGDGYITLIDEKYFKVGKYRHKVFEEYIKNPKKDIISIAKKELVSFGIEFDEYIKSKKIFEDFLKRDYLKYKVIATEQRFNVILPNGVCIKGTIDLTLEVNKNTILINDYKTGDYPLTQQYLENSIQMKIYVLAVKSLYPQYKNILCQIDAVNFDVFKKNVNEDPAWLDGFDGYLESIYDTITKKSEEKDFQPKYCTICSRCEFYKSCPLIKNLDKLQINPLSDIKKWSLQELSKNYLEYTNINKAVFKNIELLKSAITNTMKYADTNCIIEDWGKVEYKNNRLFIDLK